MSKQPRKPNLTKPQLLDLLRRVENSMNQSPEQNYDYMADWLLVEMTRQLAAERGKQSLRGLAQAIGGWQKRFGLSSPDVKTVAFKLGGVWGRPAVLPTPAAPRSSCRAL